MLYEDPNEDPQSDKRFHVELHFSPGAIGTFPEVDFPQGGGFRPASRPSSRGVRIYYLCIIGVFGLENYLTRMGRQR